MSSLAVKIDRSHSGELLPAAEYLPFVQKVARRMSRRLPSHICFDDLVSAGVVGLLEAMERYDAAKVDDFTSYAEFRIKGSILDDLRRRDVMARDARIKSKQIESGICELRSELGREPEEHEIAEKLGYEVEELREKLQKLTPVRMVSIDDVNVEPGVSHNLSPFDKFAKKELIGRLAEAIRTLSERQQQVLHLYYREDLNLREIGEVLGVTESRVCQILSEATLRLRTLLAEPELGQEKEDRG